MKCPRCDKKLFNNGYEGRLVCDCQSLKDRSRLTVSLSSSFFMVILWLTDIPNSFKRIKFTYYCEEDRWVLKLHSDDGYDTTPIADGKGEMEIKDIWELINRYRKLLPFS